MTGRAVGVRCDRRGVVGGVRKRQVRECRREVRKEARVFRNASHRVALLDELAPYFLSLFSPFLLLFFFLEVLMDMVKML